MIRKPIEREWISKAALIASAVELVAGDETDELDFSYVEESEADEKSNGGAQAEGRIELDEVMSEKAPVASDDENEAADGNLVNQWLAGAAAEAAACSVLEAISLGQLQ